MGEIQRLKAEASRFIAILSQEEEYEKSDQQLSPTKKQSLTKEVESLQVTSQKCSMVVAGGGGKWVKLKLEMVLRYLWKIPKNFFCQVLRLVS